LLREYFSPFEKAGKREKKKRRKNENAAGQEKGVEFLILT